MTKPAELFAVEQPPRPAYVAYGNSITAGWCAGGAGYPQRLAEMNGWEPVNLGLPSVRIEPSHGDVIGGAAHARRAALVTIMVGIEELYHCDRPATGPFQAMLQRLRDTIGESDRDAVKKEADARAVLGLGAAAGAVATAIAARGPLPVVVVTPPVSWHEGKACGGPSKATPVDLRAQLVAAVEARRKAGDHALYVVDGPLLLPTAYMSDGVHPSADGMREVATNLNAQLGFGRVQWTVTSCPPLTVEVRGIKPGGWFDLYWGDAAGTAGPKVLDPSQLDQRTGGPLGCAGRSLMLAPRGKEARQADKDGRATVVVGQVAAAEACASLVFEVVEADGCTNSRLGSLPCKLRDASLQTCAQVATPHDSLSGTPAELWPHPPPAPPAAAAAAPPPKAKQGPKPKPKPEAKPAAKAAGNDAKANAAPPKAGGGGGPGCEGWCSSAKHCSNGAKCGGCSFCPHPSAQPPQPSASETAPPGYFTDGSDDAILGEGADEEVAVGDRSQYFDDEPTSGERIARMLRMAAAGAASALAVVAFTAALFKVVSRAMRRRRRKHYAAVLIPVHVELGGETHVLALECDGCKTLKALKVMIAEAVAEVAGVDVAPAALSVDAEDEEEGYTPIDKDDHVKSGRLRRALSLRVTRGRAQY